MTKKIMIKDKTIEKLTLEKPVTNLHYMFGIFAKLKELSFTIGKLNPVHKFINIDFIKQTVETSEKPNYEVVDLIDFRNSI